jgi:CheY-like chemotaxis protein
VSILVFDPEQIQQAVLENDRDAGAQLGAAVERHAQRRGRACHAWRWTAYLQKPFREDALIGAIQQALEGRRA